MTRAARTMQERIDAVGEAVERGLAHWSAIPAFFGLVLLGLLWWPGLEAVNLTLSILTVALLLLTVDRDRRDRSALHAKIDEVLRAVPEADDTHLARLEERAEDEIEATRS